MAITSNNVFDNDNPMREDLTDKIWLIDPSDTPFYSNCPRTKATATTHEWQTDVLAAAGSHAVADGADATFAADTDTVRLTNTCQISRKTCAVSGTYDAIDKAGMKSAMAYQLAKKGLELKRDIETALIGVEDGQIKVAGDNTPTARKLGNYTTWVTSNLSEAADASTSTGLGADQRTAGTARVFTEDMLTSVIDSIWNNGGKAEIIMAGTFNKRKITGFSGAADEKKGNVSDRTIINAVDWYVSDYGTSAVVPNRFINADDVLVYQQDMWKLAWLRPMQTVSLCSNARRFNAASSASMSAIRMSAARVSCTLKHVSRTSDDVIP